MYYNICRAKHAVALSHFFHTKKSQTATKQSHIQNKCVISVLVPKPGLKCNKSKERRWYSQVIQCCSAVTFLSFLSLGPRHLFTSPTCPVASPTQILIPLDLLSLLVQPSDSASCLHFLLLCCYSEAPFDQANLSH